MPQYSLISCRNFKNAGTSGNDEFVLHNVAAWIEGCDPVLKSEYVVYSCHADHIGTRDDSICAGADDDASGCAALLEIAEAFRNLDKKPLRSIVFLWLTGEEIGLFGSQAYINDPLFPLENTIVDLNMDMIGRVKGVADSTGETPVSGPLGVYIIADDQSSDLMSITGEADKRSNLTFDYSLSGRDNHLNLFARSDHFNFVKKDIPILFFTTGLHSDYHTPGDVIEKLDFNKLELVTKGAFEIGWEIANRKSRIIVDNPFTKRQ
jgi:Zn-dependent M28 family amino/carboxypeptidase